MYKWVVDPNIAPYPILKPFGKYASVINGNTGTPWVDRATANPYEGKQLGTLTVYVNSGSHSSASSKTLYIPITDMDTLPYYNTVFGNPNADTWAEKYANNYTDQVVTGWKITAVVTDGTVKTYNEFVPNWETGYNFADRKCINKDIYSTTNPRVFAQGGNYYVPDGVTEITIEAYWGKAIYVGNNEYSYDRVNITLGNTGSAFAPAGTRSDNFNGATIATSIRGALTDANIDAKKTVYDYALVLVGNVQESVSNSDVKHATQDTRGFTIMSVDLDFDEEPDYCLEWQLGKGMGRQEIAPIRFDFLPVVVKDISRLLRPLSSASDNLSLNLVPVTKDLSFSMVVSTTSIAVVVTEKQLKILTMSFLVVISLCHHLPLARMSVQNIKLVTVQLTHWVVTSPVSISLVAIAMMLSHSMTTLTAISTVAALAQ